MSTRRGFLTLLGLAGPAAVLAPKAMLDSGKATNIAPVKPPLPSASARAATTAYVDAPVQPMRYLGLAQLKNEGDPCAFDPEPVFDPNRIERYAEDGPYRWYDDGEDEA
jgi:hypothetical protein